LIRIRLNSVRRTMNKRKAAGICRAIGGSSVTVIGDLMLDRYFWGQVERISPEAPVPVVNVERTDVRPGGAANVAWNLISLGCRPDLVGVVGRDGQASQLRSLMRENGISTGHLVTDSSRVTTEKIRIVAHNQQVVRADFESGGAVSGRTLSRLKAAALEGIAGSGAVVISDYGKGVVAMPLMETVRQACAVGNVPVIIDPKEGRFDLYRGAFALTPNLKEAGGFYNMKIRTPGELETVGRSLLEALEAHAVLITRAEEGMTLFEEGKAPRHFPTRASEVYDVTGAGDTVISVFAAAIAAGASIYDSIELANSAAGIVVRELGTATVSVDELAGSFAG